MGGALDSDVLIQALVECPVPTVVAVGHASDRLVLAEVADRSFPTPTGFGVWLRGALERKEARAADAARAKAVQEQGNLARTNAELTAANVRLTASVSALSTEAAARGQEVARARAEAQAMAARMAEAERQAAWRVQAAMARTAQAAPPAPSEEVRALRETVVWLKVGLVGAAVAVVSLLVVLVLQI